LDQASISSHANRGPVYDEAYLNELKASTASSRPRFPEGGAHDEDTLMSSVQGDLVVESLENSGNKSYNRSSVFADADTFSSSDTGVAAIPSQSAVVAAKEKRERIRAIGTTSSHADEYISLSLTTRDDGYRGPHPESRLMREDDDLGEGDDGAFIQSTTFSANLSRICRVHECPDTNSSE
jgi:GC-rich sequence DNA-binding factor